MPNQITLLRLVFIPLIVISVLDGNYRHGLWLLAVAGLSDAVDGLLARVLRQKTELGLYLDPVADKLLLSTMFIVLTATGDIPLRVTILVFSRDVVIIIVASVLYATNTARDFRPSLLGKANTAVQILLAATVLAELAFVVGFGWFTTFLVYGSGLLTLLSAAAYLVGWLKHMAGYAESEHPHA